MKEELSELLEQRIVYSMLLTQTLSMHYKVQVLKEYAKDIYDVQLCISWANLDIAIGLKHLNVAIVKNNSLEANYFARILSLNCHELFNDVNKLTAQLLRKIKLIADKEIQSELEEVRNKIHEINELKSFKFKIVKDIRHNLIAHRLGSGLEQANKTDKIDLIEIEKVSTALYNLCFELFNLLTPLTLPRL